LAEAEEKDAQLARGELAGPLHGFPHAVKDLVPVQGMRMTMGSPILKDFVPTADSVMVRRLRKAGAIFIGKTNTPEFGLGSHTYNPVYGITRNAYNQTRSAGGSSGGAAVALALRMVPVADGSDYGGSLRNPAGWNNVFGFRTSYGLVPADGRDAWLPSMGVLGPMARNVRDLAMLLAVQAGYDDRVPLSMDASPTVFQGTKLDRDLAPFQRAASAFRARPGFAAKSRELGLKLSCFLAQRRFDVAAQRKRIPGIGCQQPR
jgi:amidase